MMSALLEEYKTNVVPALMERLSRKNRLAVPRLLKIIVSMGISSSEDGKEALENVSRIIAVVTGQKPAPTKARKSIAGFKIREGDIVGCMTTLRGKRMYEFLERLIHAAIPRVRDFRGMDPNSFDGRGNYSMGMEEGLIFPELNPDDTKAARGMNVTIVTSTDKDEEATDLLRMLGMPLRNDSGGG